MTTLSPVDRKMPERMSLGERVQSTMLTPVHNWRHGKTPNTQANRTVVGSFVHTWQRRLVWTPEQ